MAEMKFNCPHCGQTIACDELWGGHQIQCPMCNKEMMVPAQTAAAPAAQNPLVPKPPASAAPKLSIGHARHQPSTPPQAAAGSTLARSAAAMAAPKKKSSGAATKYIGYAAAVAILAVAAYFVWPIVKKWQDKTTASHGSSSTAGEVGHTAALYKTLDATDPDKMGTPVGGVVGRSLANSRRAAAAREASAGLDSDSPAASAGQSAVPYTLELSSATIPEAKVGGMISGSKFVADTTRIDMVGGSPVLRFFHGDARTPDHEIMIYLHSKPGEALAGRNWMITSDMKGAGVPSVVKRWKADSRYAPKMQTYSTGYAMKLELGAASGGNVPGKIYVALPDAEKSAIAGVFTVSMPAAIASAPAAAAPAKTLHAIEAPPAERYGVQP